MKNKTLGMAALLLILSPFALAQETEWKTLNEEVLSLIRQGNSDRAVMAAKKALQIAEQTEGPDHPDVATSLNNLALLYKAQGN